MNKGVEFNELWLNSENFNLACIRKRASELSKRRCVKKIHQAAWLFRAITCIDATTLSGDDTFSNVQRLCHKAARPIRSDIVDYFGMSDLKITTGAVCVYPNRVAEAKSILKKLGCDVKVASVATGFPSGQTPLESRLLEIRQAVADGADEIDVVINRQYSLSGQWKNVYEEVIKMKKACGKSHMKTILATGELGSMENVYKASMVCMMAGTDFIKTSTGKESVNAVLPVGLVMVRAIRHYYQKTGFKVGFKPAGGIRTAKDSLTWLSLMKEELSDDWLNNNLFRLGASSLLTDVERQLFHCAYGRYAAEHELAMV